jgi:hypothetical protein
MSTDTDTNSPASWTPFHLLAILGFWLLSVIVLAIAIASRCGSHSPAPTNGSITVAWSILDRQDNPATCAQVGARTIALRLRNGANGEISAISLPCEASPGAASVAPGIYDIALELRAADNATLATAPEQVSVAIVAGQLTRLTPVIFAASTETSVVLSIKSTAGSNCQPVANGGAGITSATLTLEHAGDGCAPVTFLRRRGSEPIDKYKVNCSSPLVTQCIAEDETLTASLAPGRYRITVNGNVNAQKCWQRVDELEVPLPGRSLVHELGLVRQDIPGC